MKKESYLQIKLLKIWEILTQDSDENNPISSKELLQRLSSCGIEITRKTLYHDIYVLNRFGYEIMCRRGKTNEYYVLDRKFNQSELHILLDAIQSASFITQKKTEELVNKIASLSGSTRGEVLKRNIVNFNTTKNTNDAIYYCVNEIVTAIERKKEYPFDILIMIISTSDIIERMVLGTLPIHTQRCLIMDNII